MCRDMQHVCLLYIPAHTPSSNRTFKQISMVESCYSEIVLRVSLMPYQINKELE